MFTKLPAKQLPQVATAINTLTAFLAMRDVPTLTPAAIHTQLGQPLDTLILFGGSPIAGLEHFVKAMRAGVAQHYLIVGGHGHTTPKLRAQLSQFSGLDLSQVPSEAEMFQRVAQVSYGQEIPLLETQSTNSGNNVTNSLAVLRRHDIVPANIGLIQDGSLQRRLAAGFSKEVPTVPLVNFAAYQISVVVRDGQLAFAHDEVGMWSLSDYVNLVMGEIPRLHDTSAGYGPAGAGYIAHVAVPADVLAAHRLLQEQLGVTTRVANAEFKTISED
ncbi:YdcF family protein [Levilactobacillus cerevisiae]|uniref:YdcF family protein n=1 Tax=Levilactobacillus cerevisiae TaxID=1704076 RepID=UPI00345E9C35